MKEQVYINKSSEVYDAIVIGSGISGGWAAKEFCERGYKTLMIQTFVEARASWES